MSLEFNYDLYPKQVIDLIKADELDNLMIYNEVKVEINNKIIKGV